MGRDEEQVSFTVRLPRGVFDKIDAIRQADRRSINWTVNELLSEALRARGADVAKQREES